MLGDQLVVLSDAHVRPSTDVEPLLAFLDAVPTLGDCLLINGDLFEFWFSYRRAVPRAGFPIAAALTALRRKIPIVMTGGNHDRWGDAFWSTEANIAFSPGRLRIAIRGRTILAVHGDGIGESSRAAETTHTIISHPLTARMFGWLHPDVGIWLVERFGGHLADSTRDPAILDQAESRQRAWAAAQFADDPDLATVVISHTHRAYRHEASPGRLVVNPGAWVEGRRYAIVTAHDATLHSFAG